MGEKTKVSWATDTWNPWTGCRSVSEACRFCYARSTVTNRLQRDFSKRIRNSEATRNAPLKWNKKPWVCECGMAFGNKNTPHDSPIFDKQSGFITGYVHRYDARTVYHRRRIFSLSLGDWLDPEVPIEWLEDMLDVIRRCPDCDFLLLTKRPELWKSRIEAVLKLIESQPTWDTASNTSPEAQLRNWLADWFVLGKPPSGIWLGVTVENQEQADKRIPELLRIPAKVHFLSCEPLLTSVNIGSVCGLSFNRNADHTLRTDGGKLDWIITGCESGSRRRNQEQVTEHARYLVRQCQAAGVPVFVKQLPVNGKVSHNPAEWPSDLQVQDFPTVPR